MVDYHDSSQLNNWLFETEDELNICRARANYEARMYLRKLSDDKKKQSHDQQHPPIPTTVDSSNSKDCSSNNNNNGGTQQQQPQQELPSTTISTTSNENERASNGSSVNNNTPSLLLSTSSSTLPILHFACDIKERMKTIKEQPKSLSSNNNNNNDIAIGYEYCGPMEDSYGRSFLNPKEEAVLVSFYTSKLASIIGPGATVPRLRRESKVLATAAILLRRFFLSNSVMLFDPKSIMVASAFLASKVEDVTADVRYIEEATLLMNAHVPLAQIVQAEVYLLAGINFYLLCFHPYKAVLALTEDLRTFYKTSAGKRLLSSKKNERDTKHQQSPSSSSTNNVIITGQDLKPIYDTARVLLDDVVVSDIPLFNTPGQIGLSTLIAAQEIVSEQFNNNPVIEQQKDNNNTNQEQQLQQPPPQPPVINFIGYVKERFPKETNDASKDALMWLPSRLSILTQQVRDLKNGKYGCGHYITDLASLKKIHKKLKKVRLWTNDSSSTTDNNNNNTDEGNTTHDQGPNKKKKNKIKSENKRKEEDTEQSLLSQQQQSPPLKRVKTE